MSSPYSEPAPSSGAPGGKTSFMTLDSNVAAMLCYILNFVCCLGLVLSIIFAITEKENRFVKFHAVQSLFLTGLQIVVGILVGLLGIVLSLALHMIDMEFLAWILILGLRFLLFAIFIVFWIIAGIKAYGGQWYKLPIIGEFAWKTVNN
ncbi:MAG TPA: DUF4870 domain-containing protein [Pyrinomonadaceae bacterium]|jgi:uncharacterized membrane protein|nr:DUF4870 domain-containing protein [Pyrinomonadaceae bacterium]